MSLTDFAFNGPLTSVLIGLDLRATSLAVRAGDANLTVSGSHLVTLGRRESADLGRFEIDELRFEGCNLFF
jgi:hypothetical protein